MTTAQAEVEREYRDAFHGILVCSSCRDPDAAPRAVVHASGNPWLSKLVCAFCGALWAAERIDRSPTRD